MDKYRPHIIGVLLLLTAALAILSYSGPSDEALSILFDTESRQFSVAQLYAIICSPFHSVFSHSEASYLGSGLLFFFIIIYLIVKNLDHFDIRITIASLVYVSLITLWHQLAIQPSSLPLFSIVLLVSISLNSKWKFSTWMAIPLVILFIDIDQPNLSRTLKLLIFGNQHFLWIAPAIGLLVLNQKKWITFTPLYIIMAVILLFDSSALTQQKLLALVPPFSILMAHGLAEIKRYSFSASIGISYIAAFLFLDNQFVASLICIILALILFLLAYLDNQKKKAILQQLLYSSLLGLGLVQLFVLNPFKRNEYFNHKNQFNTFIKSDEFKGETIVTEDSYHNRLLYWCMEASMDSEEILSHSQFNETNTSLDDPYILIYSFDNKHPFFNQGVSSIEYDPQGIIIRKTDNLRKIQPLLSSINTFDKKQENWTFDIRKVDRQNFSSSPYGHKLDRYSPTLNHPLSKDDLPNYIKIIEVESKINWFSAFNVYPKLVVTLNSDDSTLVWKSSPFQATNEKIKEFNCIKSKLQIQLDTFDYNQLNIYIWNPENIGATIDDFVIDAKMY